MFLETQLIAFSIFSKYVFTHIRLWWEENRNVVAASHYVCNAVEINNNMIARTCWVRVTLNHRGGQLYYYHGQSILIFHVQYHAYGINVKYPRLSPCTSVGNWVDLFHDSMRMGSVLKRVNFTLCYTTF